MLGHPGAVRLEKTLLENFAWPRLRDDVLALCKTCETCQVHKKQRKHYGELPLASPPGRPWDTVAVDLIGPYEVRFKNQVVQLRCLTMIDVRTRWFEMVRVKRKDAELVALNFDRVWLSRYPRPARCLHDNGTEFLGSDFQELLQSYGIKPSVTTIRNPQANAILERVHQVLGNLLRTAELSKVESDVTGDEDPFDGILAATAFAIRATYHTSLEASPGQLVFRRDMLFPTTYLANWHQLDERKKQQMQRDNERENAKRIPHDYKVGDLVLIRRDLGGEQISKLDCLTHGPYPIVRVHVNGTVTLQRDGFREKINIRRILPFWQQDEAGHVRPGPRRRH